MKEIVIKLEDDAYNFICSKGYHTQSLYNAIREGTVLPEHHGRLLILSEDKVKQELTDVSFSAQKWISEVELSNATVAILEATEEE